MTDKCFEVAADFLVSSWAKCEGILHHLMSHLKRYYIDIYFTNSRLQITTKYIIRLMPYITLYTVMYCF